MKNTSLACFTSAILLLPHHAHANCTTKKAVDLIDRTLYFNPQERLLDIKVNVLVGKFFIKKGSVDVFSSGKSLSFTCHEHKPCIRVMRPHNSGFETQASFYLNDLNTKDTACIAAYTQEKLVYKPQKNDKQRSSESIYDALIDTKPATANHFAIRLQTAYKKQLSTTHHIKNKPLTRQRDERPTANTLENTSKDAHDALDLSALGVMLGGLEAQDMALSHAKKMIHLMSQAQQANTALLDKYAQAIDVNSPTELATIYRAVRSYATQSEKIAAEAATLAQQTYVAAAQKKHPATASNWKAVVNLSQRLHMTNKRAFRLIPKQNITESNMNRVKMLMQPHLQMINVMQNLQNDIVDRVKQ